MKKFLALLIVSIGGYAVFRQFASQNADRDLWAEVTDAVRQ